MAVEMLPWSFPGFRMQAESMQVKSYFADSVELAIQAARQALGADAVLITSRRAAPEAASRGAYEVVFGISSPEAPSQADAGNEELGREVAALRDQFEAIKRLLKQQTHASGPAAQPEIELIQQELADAGLSDSLIPGIVQEFYETNGASRRPTAADNAALRSAVLEKIRSRVRFAPSFDPQAGSGPRVLAFAGPPGAGKTTTLAKIAMRECLGCRLSVRIISIETHRVAAQEKLRSLAKILGLGFTAANSMREFIEALDEYRGKDVLLIDTPGYGRRDFEAAADLIRFLKQMNSKEVHLVLPASMNRDDLIDCMRRYETLAPDYLLFTKLDETESRAAALSAALEADKPLSYFGTGQLIPEDLEPANWTSLAGTLLQPKATASVSAA